jgi:PEP-CTERM motif
MTSRIFALSALAMLSAGAAHATTYFDTITAFPTSLSGAADGPAQGATLMAQSFSVPGTPDFSRVTLALSASGRDPGNLGSFTVFLIADDGAGGQNLAGFPQTNLTQTAFAGAVVLGTISDNQLSPGTPTLISLSISQAAVATIGLATQNQEFWIGIDATDPNTSVEWALSTADTTGVGTDGQSLFDNGALIFGAFEMIVDTPEPASLAILGAGLAALGYFRRRRSAKV